VEGELQEMLEMLKSLPVLDLADAVQALTIQCLSTIEDPKGYWEEIDLPVKALLQLNSLNNVRVYPLLLQTAGDLQTSQASRKRAIIALGEIGDRRAVDLLLGVLEKASEIEYSKEDSTIRNTACALAVLGDERVVMPVLRAARKCFGSGAGQDWAPRAFIAAHLSKVVIPGSAVHAQVLGMQAGLHNSQVFWDNRIEEMIDQVLGKSEITHY
jgi:hypothetical protein